MWRKKYEPKLKVTIEFCDSSEECLDAYTKAISSILNMDNVNESSEK